MHSTLQLMRRWTFDLDIELAHGQPALYWARPVNVDDGLEVIMWIRRLGGERLPTASYALRPNLNKPFVFALERRDRDFCHLFSTHQPTTHLRFRYRTNPRSTRFVSGKAGEYRWRRPKFHVDLGGESLLVMSYALCPNPKNASFLPSEMDRYCLLSVLYTPVVKCFFLRRLAGARHV